VTVWKAHQTVYEDGAVDVLEVTAQHGFEWNQYVLPYKNGRPRLQQGNWFSIGKKRLNVYAYGWDRESAVKAVVDRVAAIRADQLGVS
jgi:hypothetical protein